MDTIRHDVRDAFRKFRRSPGFAAIAIAVLAIGLGVNTAIFSVVNAVLLRPLPVRAPEELVFGYLNLRGYYGGMDDDAFEQLSAQGIFKEAAGAGGDLAWTTIDGQTRKLIGAAVTANYFQLLGVDAARGRVIGPGDDTAAGPRAMVVSDTFWRTALRADAHVLGRRLRLSPGDSLTERPGQDYVVVGVLPAGFNGTGSMASWTAPDYFVIARQRALDDVCAVIVDGALMPGHDEPHMASMVIVARLNDGVRFDEAASTFRQFGAEWIARNRAAWPNGNRFELRATRAQRLPIDNATAVVPERLATALMVAAGLVVLVAASNLVGVMLSRGLSSRGETAVRLSLGAGRWRVARQHLIESLLLAAAGCVAGTFVAGAIVQTFLIALPTQAGASGSVLALHVPLDWRVLMFSVVAALAIAGVIALGPARQAATTNVLAALQQNGAPSHQSRRRFRYAIVIPQIAIALALLLVSGSLARTLARSEWRSAGYDPQGLVAVQFTLARPDECRADQQTVRSYVDRARALSRRIDDSIHGAPGVSSAAMTGPLPHQGPTGGYVTTPDLLPVDGHYGVQRFFASPDYFQTMGIRLQAGRFFVEADAAKDFSSPPGAYIVSRRFADIVFPHLNPIGQRIAIHASGERPPQRWGEVVGVVGDVLPPVGDGEPAPAVYSPMAPGFGLSHIVARTAGSPADAIRTIGQLVNRADPTLAVISAEVVADTIARIRFARRTALAVLLGCAAVGLALAGIGLYGVVAYSIAQRFREFGVRAALGAEHIDLVLLVIKEALVVTSAGAVLGIGAAFAATAVISRNLVTIPAITPAVIVAGALIVVTAVLAACYLPARRASRVDPVSVLRA